MWLKYLLCFRKLKFVHEVKNSQHDLHIKRTYVASQLNPCNIQYIGIVQVSPVGCIFQKVQICADFIGNLQAKIILCQ